MVWTELATLVGLPLLRSAFGWLENSFEDGTIEPFEWGQLASTVIRVGVPGILLYFGLNEIPGIEVSALTAAAAAFIGDLVARWIKKKR